MVLLWIIFALITLLYFYFTRNFNYWKNMGIAGPKPVPIFGNIAMSALRKRNYGVHFKDVYDAFPEEKVVGIYRMTTPCLLIRDLDVIKHIMIKDFDAFYDRGVRFSEEFLGQNLFNADGDKWRLLRARFSPIFTSVKLRNMLPLMIERADTFTKYLEELCGKQKEHEVHSLAQKYTMANIGACTLGLNIDTQYDQKMIDNLNKIDELVFDLNYANELDFMCPGILTTLNSSLFPAYVKTFITDILKDAMVQRNGMPSTRRDFLDLILEMRQVREIHGRKSNDDVVSLELTDDVIIAQAFVFFSAGYATSATTMAYMMYELSKHPDIQDKLIADIDRVMEKHNGKLTLDTLQDMTYLEKVFDETLRKYPLVDPLQRQAQVNYKIPGTEITIPKGTYVIVSALGIHRDPKYYKDPEKFNPERFELSSKEQHPCAYLPFGVGPRNCIGMRFAKVQSRVGVIKFLSKFRVNPSKNTPNKIPICPKRAITGPYGGIKLNIVKR